MITYLIRKFDNWWLSQIDIGLVQMTIEEYYSYKIAKSFLETIFKGKMTYTAKKGFSGLAGYVTTNAEHDNSISE